MVWQQFALALNAVTFNVATALNTDWRVLEGIDCAQQVSHSSFQKHLEQAQLNKTESRVLSYGLESILPWLAVFE